ncbi:MAG: hypothetical protein WD969_11820, partial [Paracoccaceae bacterium]
MSAPRRRGACPTLAAPMETGDGWLVRIALRGGVSTAQLSGLAHAAGRLGNGLIEVTSRGGVQIRGLTETSAAEMASVVEYLEIGLKTGLSALTGPLAGVDPEEIADPRQLAAAIELRAGAFAERLSPKASLIVDGGGVFGIGALGADFRLTAEARGWRVEIGGRDFGLHDAETAAGIAADGIERLAALGPEARARDLPQERGERKGGARPG